MVPNVQSDNKIEIRLLEEEGFKSTPECWEWRHRNNVFRQCIPYSWSSNVEVRVLTVDSVNNGTARLLVLGECSARWPGRSATQSSGPRYHGAVLPKML